MAPLGKFGNPPPGRLEPEDILTPEQLSMRLHVPLSWIYKKSAAAGLPTLRCGRYLRFSWPEVVNWMRNSSGNP
jgi:hypothetical protein